MVIPDRMIQPKEGEEEIQVVDREEYVVEAAANEGEGSGPHD